MNHMNYVILFFLIYIKIKKGENKILKRRKLENKMNHFNDARAIQYYDTIRRRKKNFFIYRFYVI